MKNVYMIGPKLVQAEIQCGTFNGCKREYLQVFKWLILGRTEHMNPGPFENQTHL